MNNVRFYVVHLATQEVVKSGSTDPHAVDLIEAALERGFKLYRDGSARPGMQKKVGGRLRDMTEQEQKNRVILPAKAVNKPEGKLRRQR